MQTEEIWKTLPGHEGRYEVSDQGRIRSWQPWRGTPVPRILKPGHDHHGYPYVILTGPGVRRRGKLHRLVALAFLGPVPDGQEVRHLDGDSSNARLGNLAYGTHAENGLDTVRHGAHGNAKKTHCPQGHEYSGANTYVSAANRRYCRACRLTRQH